MISSCLRGLVLAGAAAGLIVLAASCTVGPNYATPNAKVAAQWLENSSLTNRPAPLAETLWWQTFQDPVLNDLVETAYRNNPSLQIAGVRILEARAKLNKSIGNLFPQQQDVGGGEFGVSGNNALGNSLSDMFSWENRAVNAGAGMVFPIFNYGRLVNQVRVQDAQFQQAVLNYQKTVLAAQQEVENGLATFADQQKATASLAQAKVAAGRSTELAMIQYKGGQTDYTTVLTAQQSQLAVEESLASAQGNVVLGLISVYRALGGGWEIREGQDVISDEVKVRWRGGRIGGGCSSLQTICRGTQRGAILLNRRAGSRVQHKKRTSKKINQRNKLETEGHEL